MPSQYSATVNFNFEGVEKEIYPNGSTFSPNYLVSSNFLRRVFDELQLAEQGLNFWILQRRLLFNRVFTGKLF
ncbi:MAG TPA: hypothetical protein EYN35_08095 [Methylococcales bacterium]|nr:hypothetical protein [Methylococcales bacterium]